MVRNVHWSSCKVPVILGRFQLKLNFLDRFSESTLMSKFMKIRPVGAELFHVDGLTDGQPDKGTDRHEQADRRFSQFFEGAKIYLHLYTGKRRSKFFPLFT